MRAAAQRAVGPQIDSAQMLIEESHVDLPAESVAPEERDESTPPAAALNTAPEVDKTADPSPTPRRQLVRVRRRRRSTRPSAGR